MSLISPKKTDLTRQWTELFLVYCRCGGGGGGVAIEGSDFGEKNRSAGIRDVEIALNTQFPIYRSA
jgi:hypothetical protein